MPKVRMLEEFERRMTAVSEVDRAMALSSLESIRSGEVVLGEMTDEMKLIYVVMETSRAEGNALHAEFLKLHMDGVEHDDALCDTLKEGLGRCEVWLDFTQELLYGEWRLFEPDGFKKQLLGVRAGWKLVWRQKEELMQEALREPGNLGGAIKAAIERTIGGRAELITEIPLDGSTAESFASLMKTRVAAANGGGGGSIAPTLTKKPD